MTRNDVPHPEIFGLQKFFGSSVDYMILFAMAFSEIKTIQLCGIDMINPVEYMTQRPSLAYWLGAAEASGIKIVLPKNSTLLNYGRQYGETTKIH